MVIEQAIFTSLHSDRAAGYQLAAYSPGIGEEDLREISAWGPSHDSLLDQSEDAESINFHPLPSGVYCISKTTYAGSEYSGRSGPRIYSQCLVVPTEVLGRFANNPFAVLKAAFAQGSLRVHEKVPQLLEPFRLSGRAASVDQSLLTQLLAEPGSAWLGAIAQAAISTRSLGLVAGAHGARLIAGLLNCLPLECRAACSFSTGLKYSPRRPFRIVCVPSDLSEQRRMMRQYEITILDLAGNPPREFTHAEGWGGWIACAIASGHTAFLAEQLAVARAGLVDADLNALGHALLEAMASGSTGSTATCQTVDPTPSHGPNHATSYAASNEHNGTSPGRRADEAHARFRGCLENQAGTALLDDLHGDPSQSLGDLDPQLQRKLAHLDDLVFESIAGKPGGLERLRQLWREVQPELGHQRSEESREAYVRHALRLWKECVQGDQVHNPRLAIGVMDVMAILFGE